MATSEPPKILITGGAGFIGRWCVRQFLDAGWRVMVFDKLTYAGHLESLSEYDGRSDYRFQQGDIGDFESVMRSLESFRPQAVLNLAAETHVDRSIQGPADFVQTNVVGVTVLLEACRLYWEGLARKNGFRFLQVSTDEVFGSLGEEGRFHETSSYQPNSPYSASKAAADHFVRAYYKTYGFPALITYSCNNYGPFQFPEKLIPFMILNAIQGRELPLYGDGNHIRDWIYVEDHCAALLRVVVDGVPGETYVIGAEQEWTNLQLVRQICAYVEQEKNPAAKVALDRIRFVSDRPGHDRRYAIDPSRIRMALGWKPKHRFEDSLKSTVDWYRTNLRWVEQVSKRGNSG